MPAVALVLGAVASVQVGAALAATLFDDLGPAGTTFLRVGLAAVALVAIWRPGLHGRGAGDLRLTLLFGVALAGMNLCFYLAIDRIPLGIAVTFEFVGPLAVALATSRRPLDALWVLLAGAGVVLLSAGGDRELDPGGVALALAAGAFWAAYILLGARVGRAFPGGSGLALAMVAATALVAPAGIADAGASLVEPGLVAAGATVALLSSVIPYSLELEALRRLPARVFGVLMSLEPGVAALVGYLVLDQALGAREALGIGLVVAASGGAARTARGERPPWAD